MLLPQERGTTWDWQTLAQLSLATKNGFFSHNSQQVDCHTTTTSSLKSSGSETVAAPHLEQTVAGLSTSMPLNSHSSARKKGFILPLVLQPQICQVIFCLSGIGSLQSQRTNSHPEPSTSHHVLASCLYFGYPAMIGLSFTVANMGGRTM